MYVPLMHARQEERLAIREIAVALAAAGNVNPLFIPVRDTKAKPGVAKRQLEFAVGEVSKAKLPTYVLTTPFAHKTDLAQNTILKVLEEFDGDGITIPVVAVTGSKPLATLIKEIAALGGKPFGVLHRHVAADPAKLQAELVKHKIVTHFFYEEDCDAHYWDRWKKSDRILLHDGFDKKQRNADHIQGADVEYSDLGYRYAGKGFDGYGDHTICGELFTPSGGGKAAITVAIHLTFQTLAAKKKDSIWIRHFLSNDSTGTALRGDCVRQALNKLAAFVNLHSADFAFSTACQYFVGPHALTSSLGKLKRKSMQHHIELMSHLNL